MNIHHIEKIDREIARAIESEICRQRTTLELIASENFTSPAVMAVQGSLLTNKYAEGYPTRRYYGGCENVDIIEDIAIKRAKELFGAAYANVQPHSGSQANMTAYFALLKPGDTILGMNLSHGGHLTHGSPASFSGKLFNFIHYGVRRDTGIIDYDMVRALAEKHRPKMIVAGASAYPRFIDFDRFSQIARSIDAYLMVDMAHIAGLVAGGVHPSPVPYADVVTSTTHKTLRGARGGLILAREDHSGKLNRELFPGVQGGPLMHIIAAKAVTFKEAATEAFKIYQKNIVANAKSLAEFLTAQGIDLVSGGTDNHMMLADLRRLNLTGKEAEEALDRAGITVNKNSIPFETQSPFVTSGIRIGTPAVTTRGMTVNEMIQIGKLIMEVLRAPERESVICNVRSRVRELCEAFPVYQYLDGETG